ncbi:hypothetical protein EMIT0210MI2_10078 [Priestia megaterium]|jgi:hypothetical protein
MPSFLAIIQMHLFRSSDITPVLMITKGFMSYIHPYKQKKIRVSSIVIGLSGGLTNLKKSITLL